MQSAHISSTTSEQIAIQRIALEWNGTLAGSTHSSALFSLYLAMHDTRVELKAVISEKNVETDTVLNKLKALNHYRREALASSLAAINNHKIQGQLRVNKNIDSARLYECFHPTPIHHRNNPAFIDEHIKTNCRISTQWSLNAMDNANSKDNSKDNAKNDDTYDNDQQIIETDLTMFSDIVESSRAML